MEKNKSRWKKGSSGEVGVERGAIAVINRVEGEAFYAGCRVWGLCLLEERGEIDAHFLNSSLQQNWVEVSHTP